MKALFTAYLPGVPPTNPPAAYDLKGNYNIATKQFVLTPVKWESRAPAGYVMVGMSGTYDAASKRLSGKITNARCGAFDVTRE